MADRAPRSRPTTTAAGGCGAPASASACSRGRASTPRSSSVRCSASCMRRPSRRPVELQNAVAYGLTAGLHTQDPGDLAFWLDRVQAGNLYVNRGITGAIVQRQPFGGWKRSAVGPGRQGGRPELPDRARLLALAAGRTGIEHPASARARLPHHGAHRVGAVVAGVREVRVAAALGLLSGCSGVGPRVRAGARRVAPRRGAEPVPVPPGAGRDPGDGGCSPAGSAARRDRGRTFGRRLRALRRRSVCPATCAARSATSTPRSSSRPTRSGCSGCSARRMPWRASSRCP